MTLPIVQSSAMTERQESGLNRFEEWHALNRDFIINFLDGRFCIVRENIKLNLNSFVTPINLKGLPTYMLDWIRSIDIKLDQIYETPRKEKVGGLTINHDPTLDAKIVGVVDYKRNKYKRMNFSEHMREGEILQAYQINEMSAQIAMSTPIFQLKEIDHKKGFVVIGPTDRPVEDMIERRNR